MVDIEVPKEDFSLFSGVDTHEMSYLWLKDNIEGFGNALVESFFKTFKREVLPKRYYKTKSEAKLDVLNYFEVYYNKKRCHSSLGYMTPNEFDLQNS